MLVVFRTMFGVPGPLKVGGLRPPTLPGTSAMGSRRIFLIFYMCLGSGNDPKTKDPIRKLSENCPKLRICNNVTCACAL